ncbi:hypothetical protein [Haliangium sp.]|uniref:hypothetical protein n=1 Tax=Haliangium sp. TaxID=2663208 RepID=UPI003D0CE7DF
MRRLTGLLTRLLRGPEVAIADAEVGRVVTIRGRVVPRDAIDSPLTGDPCVYYRYSVEQWRQSRVVGVGGDGFWELIDTDEAIVEFYVDDVRDRAIVAPAGARVARARGTGAEPIRLGDGRRAHQLVIEAGDEITVTGEAAVVADVYDESRGYRGSIQRLMLRAPEGDPLRIRLARKHRRAG